MTPEVSHHGTDLLKCSSPSSERLIGSKAYWINQASPVGRGDRGWLDSMGGLAGSTAFIVMQQTSGKSGELTEHGSVLGIIISLQSWKCF